ncbi:hypothetical protein LY08_01027 [Olleya aquimaris]|uniref:Uncharacterized protein n=1 Tax=Olleya aquimaris TaxID=639310 RepID=A0A327RJE8_9FLAO|nr:hypothetical protein LY08_01027 [Olleya aquimaris]
MLNCASKKETKITNYDKHIYTSTISDSTRNQLYLALNKYSKVKATDNVRSQLNLVLKQYSNKNKKDTLFITYRYNNGNCWKLLDQKSNEHINKIVTNNYERIINFSNQYPDRTYLMFKQQGTRHNKLVNYNKYVIEDTDNSIFKLLFEDKKTCGNSIILLPDNRFIFLKSDPHLDILNFDKNKIVKILNSANN